MISWIKNLWPFVLRSTYEDLLDRYEDLQTRYFTVRTSLDEVGSALSVCQTELNRHKILLAGRAETMKDMKSFVRPPSKR